MDTKKLRQKILDLAIRGKLVPQDPNDEPASVLLERIRAEKEHLINEGKIKRAKKSAASDTSHYENVPYVIPVGWVWCRLEDIAYVAAGSTPSKESFVEKGVPYIKMYNLRNQKIDFEFHPQYITAEVHNNKLARSRTQPGDLLMNIVGPPLGKLAIIPESLPEANFNQAAVLIRPLKYKPAITKYLFYYLSELSEINSISTKGSAGQVNISLTQSQQMRIALPPLAELERITQKIESLFSKIDVVKTSTGNIYDLISKIKSSILEKALSGKLVSQDKTDEPAIRLLKSINPNYDSTDNRHYENVPYKVPETWQWVKLKDLCVFLSRGKSPVYSETDKRYPVFAQKCNLKEGGISLKEARFLEPRTIPKWKDVYKLQDGDILVNSTGTGTVCRTRLFRSEYLCDYPFVVPDSHVSVIRTDRLISSEYAYLVLVSKFSQTYMMDNLAGSTNQKELYISVLENLLFPLPPADEQKRIVKCVNEIYMQLEQISSEL